MYITVFSVQDILWSHNVDLYTDETSANNASELNDTTSRTLHIEAVRL